MTDISQITFKSMPIQQNGNVVEIVFPRRWYGDTIFNNLKVIWEMSVFDAKGYPVINGEEISGTRSSFLRPPLCPWWPRIRLATVMDRR